ncbi:MAG: hypothetical protein JRJ59_02325 [Deltaproteobacteria bacterium]|nr:hypothetical protein [Deltaproteobacteria bacterium]
MSDKQKIEAIESVCPQCRTTKIFYLGREPMPKCDKCGREMVIRELLIEGKHD